MSNLQYFKKFPDGNYYFNYSHNTHFDAWYISVKPDGITMSHGGEHGLTDFDHDDVAGVFREAVQCFDLIKERS